MTEPNNNMQMIRPEIIAPPGVSNLSVAQVGAGMFSVTMQVVLVVRFPTDVPAVSPLEISTDHAVPQTALNAATAEQSAADGLTYGNGELPDAFDGEAEGFQTFVQVHGYVPLTREVLIQLAANSQGGA